MGIVKCQFSTLLRNHIENFTYWFGLTTYKIQLLQEFIDPPTCLIFGEWALEKFHENLQFYRRIVFSDETHIWTNRYVNKHNYRIWSNAINDASQKKTVWCCLRAGDIVGLFCLKGDCERNVNVNVNGERNRTMTSPSWTWLTCGLIETVPHTTFFLKQWTCWKMSLVSSSSLEMIQWIGLQNNAI